MAGHRPPHRDLGSLDLLSDPGNKDLERDGARRDLLDDLGVQDLTRDAGTLDARRLGLFLRATPPEEVVLTLMPARSGGFVVRRQQP